MTFLIAVSILIILSVFFMGLRAYLSFCALIVGGATAVTGLGGEPLLLFLGLLGVAYALLSAYFTVRTSPRGMLRLQILRFFGYGMFLFLQVLLTMLIIFIPLARFFGIFARSYRDVLLVDRIGRVVGTATVDDRNRGTDGKQYPRPDSLY